MLLSTLLNKAFQYVIRASLLYKIDESHGLKHSMQVLSHATTIFESECQYHPHLHQQKEIIYLSAILHDMCDKKYMQEEIGLQSMKTFLCDEKIEPTNINVIFNIISTMSYSKVKTNGYPNLLLYQESYHIVRESDLLAAYDVDRCIIYSMIVENCTYREAIIRCIDLFEKRMFKYQDDDLFVTKKGKELALLFHSQAVKDIDKLKVFLHELEMEPKTTTCIKKL